MARNIPFTKMVAAGNDFVVVEEGPLLRGIPLAQFARRACSRTSGIGADGVLVIGPSAKADMRMRIFNADGTEAEMCGNGARCAGYYLARKSARRGNSWAIAIQTKAGVIRAIVAGDVVKVKLTDPKGLKTDLPLKVNGRTMRVNFVDTGVPHAVVFSAGLEGLPVEELSPALRHHAYFAPRGANVNFIEPVSRCALKIRTYERGVEGETLACGTGSTASALIFAHKTGCQSPVEVRTKSGEALQVYFSRDGGSFSDVWLEGKARPVFTGKFPYAQGR